MVVERDGDPWITLLVNTRPTPSQIFTMRSLAALLALLALLATVRARPTPRDIARWLGLATAGTPAPAEEEGELWALLVAGSNG